VGASRQVAFAFPKAKWSGKTAQPKETFFTANNRWWHQHYAVLSLIIFMNKTFASELQKYITEQVTKLRHWLKPEPSDSLALKIYKGIYKSLAVLVLTALSPVIIVVLVVAFLAAF
jgi:hypothetical protein